MTELCAPAGPADADLAARADIEALVRRFYGRVMVDDVLAEPFTELRTTGLDSHIPVMADFWETVLFRAGLYRGSALHAHRHVHQRTPLSGRHFVRRLTVWNDTVDQMFRGPIAEHAKIQGARIAWAMHRRLTGTDTPELDTLIAR
ncbi:group III truncated hemoglobin [Mycobacterium paragordonae]|uniref:Group III truncated hemoglobin n=1 Tax=Mycobacterium paragordonae TaxID=1389713 RepID=A0A4R5WN31_9MYCO|nr:group III truncated hemoglobin [Mycobacterium paragordonae]MDP7736459.1 group III truncated hemoglobin [Mycobacterium paragordonae]PJE25393.1 MAG: cyanoglobin [Mycobacterium sp.]TDK92781.1 group III truncated hemoglobin [Mycobacterium paragordonae]TDL04789.1 group III truncated hemoglobin [Mycobacterium paragordonae]